MRGHAPQGFEDREAINLKPKDKIWGRYDGERTVREVDADAFPDMVVITLWNGTRRRWPKHGTIWARTPTPDDLRDRTSAAVAAVEHHSGEWTVMSGTSAEADWMDGRRLLDHVRQHNRYVKDSTLSDNFTSADLQRAARLGLIKMRERMGYNGRKYKVFTSLASEAQAAAERALTDQQRMDRFMERFVADYEESRIQRGDNARYWPTTVRRYGDGLQFAINAGLVVETGKDTSGRPSFVPATHYEAYSEALEQQEQIELSILERFTKASERLLSFAGSGGSGRTLSLGVEQIEKLLELLEAQS